MEEFICVIVFTVAYVALEAIKSQALRPVILKHKHLGENPKSLHRTRQSVKDTSGQRSRKTTVVFTVLEVS